MLYSISTPIFLLDFFLFIPYWQASLDYYYCATIFQYMILPIGNRCLLDDKQEVTIVKPFNKAVTKYVVETASREVILVETRRLNPIGLPAVKHPIL